MKERGIVSRRGFLAQTSVGVGSGIAGLCAAGGTLRNTQAAQPKARADRLPREVWIASLSQNRMETDRFDQMVQAMLRRMEETLPYEPDIICLPEVFPFANLRGGRPSPADVAEEPVGAISQPFADFAKSHNCNIVCPIYTKENGLCYNAAVFIDRQGHQPGTELIRQGHKGLTLFFTGLKIDGIDEHAAAMQLEGRFHHIHLRAVHHQRQTAFAGSPCHQSRHIFQFVAARIGHTQIQHMCDALILLHEQIERLVHIFR